MVGSVARVTDATGYEVSIRGFGGVDEALRMQDVVARVLCPVAEHDGPCEVPWGFSVTEDGDLLLGIYATRDKAGEVVERVRRVVGGREVVLADGSADRFEELAEQYRIEHPGG